MEFHYSKPSSMKMGDIFLCKHRADAYPDGTLYLIISPSRLSHSFSGADTRVEFEALVCGSSDVSSCVGRIESFHFLKHGSEWQIIKIN